MKLGLKEYMQAGEPSQQEYLAVIGLVGCEIFNSIDMFIKHQCLHLRLFLAYRFPIPFCYLLPQDLVCFR